MALEFAELVRAPQKLVRLMTDEINCREHARLPLLIKLPLARQKQLENQMTALDQQLGTQVASYSEEFRSSCRWL